MIDELEYTIVHTLSKKDIYAYYNRDYHILDLLDMIMHNNKVFDGVKSFNLKNSTKFRKNNTKNKKRNSFNIYHSDIQISYNSDTYCDYYKNSSFNPDLMISLLTLLYYDYIDYYSNFIKKLPFITNNPDIVDVKIYRGVEWPTQEDEDNWFVFPKWEFIFKMKRPKRYMDCKHYSDSFLYINVYPLTKIVTTQTYKDGRVLNYNTCYNVKLPFVLSLSNKYYSANSNVVLYRHKKKLYASIDNRMRYKKIKVNGYSTFRKQYDTSEFGELQYYELFDSLDENTHIGTFNKELYDVFGMKDELYALESFSISPYYCYNTYIECKLKDNTYKLYYYLQDLYKFNYGYDRVNPSELKISKSFIEAKTVEELFVTELCQHRWQMDKLHMFNPLEPTDNLEMLAPMYNLMHNTNFEFIRVI